MMCVLFIYKLHDWLRMLSESWSNTTVFRCLRQLTLVLLSVSFNAGKGDAMIDKYPAAENNLF